MRRTWSDNSIRLLSMAAVCGLAAMPVAAQRGSAQEPGRPQEMGSANPLAGPAVDSAMKTTLVKRDFEGKLERIETRPEVAALELLGLSPSQREAVDDVLRRRTVQVQRVLDENLEWFLQLQGARQSGDRQEMMTLMRAFRDVAEPLLRPSLFNQVRDVLASDQRAEFARLVDEYIDAVAAEPDPIGGMGMQRGQRRGIGGDAGREARGEPVPDSDTDTRMGDGPKEGARTGPPSGAPGRRRVEMNLVIREIGRSFGAMVEERREHMDELLKVINASEAQEAKIREIGREQGENSAMSPTSEQRAERFQRIMRELTPEQRRALMDWKRGRPGAK